MALKKEDIVETRQRKYLGKDFNGLRSLLLDYARQYYSNRIQDFSESSLGGLFLDLAAFVGDNMSFYLDHQFNELFPDSSVEQINIERHLDSSGVEIVGASPALVPVSLYIQVPIENSNTEGIIPKSDSLPIVKSGTVFTSISGIDFYLLEDIDFSKKNSSGEYVSKISVGQTNSLGEPQTFVMEMTGLCISGQETTETFYIGNTFVPFRQIYLSNPDVTDIINVIDDFGNIYHRVSFLTNDVVYQNIVNTSSDNDLVKDSIRTIPAPYRFVAKTNLSNRTTFLTFGGGEQTNLNDDLIPDPSDFALSLPYSTTFSRFSINPNQLLKTKTLGVASTNTSLTVTYRHGGGLNHNVAPNTITEIKSLNIQFPFNPSFSTINFVRSSIEVTNLIRASGGEDSPTTDELTSLIPSVRNSQERIVTKEDLIARVYSLPSNFGRVFRASVKSNPNNPLSTQLFVISRDDKGNLITSPDTLKQNLQKFLAPYRLISDAIDILDAKVINLKLKYDILIDPSLKKENVIQQTLLNVKNVFETKNFHIDQPINISDITNAIFKVPGVVSVDRIAFECANGIINNRQYSDVFFSVDDNTIKNLIVPPAGGIFEIRYPDFDITGRSI